MIGIGLEPERDGRPSRAAIDRLGVPEDFVLYLGRVDRNKGCATLLEYFLEYVAEGGATTLVLAGPSTLPIPHHPRIRALGYVADEVRHALLAHARALIVPSPYESLSIVLLEGWNHATPAIVNAYCKVLKGQVQRADGGLYYRSSREFQEALSWLLADENARHELGAQGLAYVDREYRWPTVIERVESLLEEVSRRRSAARA